MTTSVSLSTFTRAPKKVLPLLDEGPVQLRQKFGPPLCVLWAADLDLLEARAAPGSSRPAPSVRAPSAPAPAAPATSAHAQGSPATDAPSPLSPPDVDHPCADIPVTSTLQRFDVDDEPPPDDHTIGLGPDPRPTAPSHAMMVALLSDTARQSPTRFADVVAGACPWLADLPPAVVRHIVRDAREAVYRGGADALDSLLSLWEERSVELRPDRTGRSPSAEESLPADRPTREGKPTRPDAGDRTSAQSIAQTKKPECTTNPTAAMR